MRLTLFESKLAKRIEDKLPGAAPGLALQVHQAGKKVCDIAVGDVYTYYDLASLTKVIFTVQSLVLAFQEGKWTLNSKVSDILDWFPHKRVRIIDCLTHTTGLPWWLPIYQKVDLSSPIPERWQVMKETLISTSLENEGKSVYSDVGFWTLAFVLEKFYEKPLLEIWNQNKEIFYPRLSLDFHPNNVPKNPPRYYAPTEKCPWRKKILQGEVHDDNCWALGGVSSHAGLFGSIDDVGWFVLYLRSQLLGISKTIIKQKTAQTFAARALPVGMGDWALGYMLPTAGTSSSGDYFSPYSIGHTGFTGTSFWFDPIHDLSVVILSNRVMLGRERKDFAQLRPQIHNWIVEGLRRS